MRAVLASLAYFALAHAAALTGRMELRIAAIVLLLSLVLLALRGVFWLQIGLMAAVGACVFLTSEPTQVLMYAPPVLFPLLFAGLFGRSLLPGRQPLVERIVWHMHDRPESLSAAHCRYARSVTVYWCVVFVLMATINLLLAIMAPIDVWSWFSNVAAYSLPLVALLAEYAWRKRVFPVQPYRNLVDYLVRIVKLGPTLARDLGHDWRRDEANGTPAIRT